jgi:hypothetical protein
VPPSTGPASPASASPAPAATGSDAGKDGLANDLASEYAKRKDVRQELHTVYLDKYDFKGLVVALRDKAESPSAPPGLQQLLRSAEQLVRLKDWLELALRRYSREHPLRVRDLSGDATKDFSVYVSPDLRVVVLQGGKTQPSELADLKPPVVGAIVVSALHETRVPQRGIVVGAQSFARLYALPAMTEALSTDKGRHEKEPAGK